ncbi:PREDICTED: glycine-rich RNA-binding protein 2, mitochondrial-like isoform X1 [Lupinus angustifolius]|uniref:glycine-rich RNA-binding protein 2, mitochondrial-like isoform X1 n=1 Tax=Lupinus angustifolius TaxID=3871 RepID=UPI00092EFF30|nr:PREDICTED: glycine-rich RNA-binding protein 2, mitochondrial-like isoform X1 [Lupinus angustifolius]XP_019420176.1 PREDICTED: glycine-rich RNA-binding protein 2, mitochondrial-like isoform X1 [Lupinus angustifolius]
MAFFNKIGNLLKHSAAKHINQDLSASTPSIFQAIRSMSSAKVFVGGISYSTDDTSLRESFARYGEVLDAKVIIDRETGRSRGFGFITYATSEDASSAIQGMDGQDLHGRRVRVNYATERERPGFGGGGGGYGGGGGGYGGGGSYGGGGYGGGGYGGDGGRSVDSGASNYQFNENSGADLGSASGEPSSNASFGYDGQFGSNQNDSTVTNNGESTEPLEENHPRENNDEANDYAQNRG